MAEMKIKFGDWYIALKKYWKMMMHYTLTRMCLFAKYPGVVGLQNAKEYILSIILIFLKINYINHKKILQNNRTGVFTSGQGPTER